MSELQIQPPEGGAPVFRLDAATHGDLMKPRPKLKVLPLTEPQAFPEPVFPSQDDAEPSAFTYHFANGMRAFRRWLVPYMKSRMAPNEFRPILSYLFTEFKCNLDCHYCWAYDNSVKGMSEDVAKRSIDWLVSQGCRVLAFMGGEPLLRPDFIHKITAYATKNDMFVYLPTNGRLLKPSVIDRLGDAGVAAMNFAVDCVDEKPGLPKALTPIRSYFDHLVKMQRRYGYMVVFNINICRNNMDDVKLLTEIAHDNGISTDYHINESPMMQQDHFKHLAVNETYLRPEDYPRADEMLDYLAEKNKAGYIMVNSKRHLGAMKDFMRGKIDRWNCRAGLNSIIIRTDGTLAPCFPMYNATHDWGVIEKPNFDVAQLNEMKKSCVDHCLSTCNYILGYYYNNSHVLRWIMKQALHGMTGNTTAVAQA